MKMKMYTILVGVLICGYESSANEICKNNNGSMMLSEETKILAKFKNLDGTNTILVDEAQEGYTFTCHKNKNTIDSKIVFIPGVRGEQESPFSRVLEHSALSFNNRYTNTEPVVVKCVDVCSVTFIVVIFNATSICYENNSRSWDCGLDQLENEISSVDHHDMRNSEVLNRTYSIKNPISESPPFMKCDGNTKNISYLQLECCETILQKYYIDQEKSPIEILIKINETRTEETETRFDAFYMSKLYFVQNGTIVNNNQQDNYFLKKNPVTPNQNSNQNSPLLIWVTAITSAAFVIIMILFGGYHFKKRKQKKCNQLTDNGDKNLDIFVSYSDLDKDYVEGFLVPKLEDESSEQKYRCLLNVRDFVPERSTIDQITEAVESSLCTIIILSNNSEKSLCFE